MKILVLNGSPHLNGATSDMVGAFAKGAQEAGHEVNVINVAHKNIRGCMACEYCREKEKGICIQKDDMQDIYPEILSSDMVVFASAITQYYQSIVEYWGVENAGIFTANGKQNKSEEKRNELFRFGKSLS